MKAALLLVATLTTLAAQESAQPFAAIRSALSLTDLQLLQLKQTLPAVKPTVKPIEGLERIGDFSNVNGVPFHPFVPAADARKVAMLDDAQRAKLAVFAPVLEKDTIAAAAISMNLIEAPVWLRGALCPSPEDYYAHKFGLSDFQVRQLALLRQPFNALIAYKWKERAELLRLSGAQPQPLFPGPSRTGPPLPKEIVEFDAEINSLIRMQQGAKPPRDLAWNVLNKSQQEFFNEFATSLQIATEAVELGLLPPQFRGESLCH